MRRASSTESAAERVGFLQQAFHRGGGYDVLASIIAPAELPIVVEVTEMIDMYTRYCCWRGTAAR